MTTDFDSDESNTLFNSLEEGGQGIFSLMVDPRSVIERGAGEPEVRVGQELRVAIRPDSVSPMAHDVTVVWSNGFEGAAYQVRPEDVGTDLFALARFAGQDMRPLEVKIECGNVLVGSPITIDVSGIQISGREEQIQALLPVTVEVPTSALAGPAESIEVTLLIDGHQFKDPMVAQVDGTTGRYTATAVLNDDHGGKVLSVAVRAKQTGREDGVVTVNAGLIAPGKQIDRDPESGISVNSPRVGQASKVKMNLAAFTPVPDKISYQWRVDGNEIIDATKAKFKPRPAQRGRKLSVFVLAEHHEHLAMGVDIYLGTVATGIEPEYLGAHLRLKGKAKVGGKLRVANLEYELFDRAPTSIEYQWMRGKDTIVGARSKKYEPTPDDLGAKIWARVYAKLEGHRTTVLVTDKLRVK